MMASINIPTNFIGTFVFKILTVFVAMSSVQSLSVDVSPKEMIVHEEDSLTILCEADYTEADSSIGFTWWHEDTVIASGGLIQDTDKYHVTMDGGTASILRIANVDRDDAGPYTCVALDVTSTASASADITVYYPPAVHFPRCFVMNPALQDLSAVQEGTSLTLACSSDVAEPVPMISWYRVDKEPAEYVAGTIVPGEKFLRNEITVVVTEDFQDVVFGCELESIGFPHLSRKCAIDPISVLSEGTNKGLLPQWTASPTTGFSGEFDYESSDDHHANKDSRVPSDVTSPPTSVACLEAYSFADRAMVPSTVILALFLFISVVLNFLQMIKNSQINASKSGRKIACVRHQVIPENEYMAINKDQRRPSQYATLHMRANEGNSIGHYYEYDMPVNGKEPYEDMESGDNLRSRPLSVMSKASKATYEEMIDESRPTSVASAGRPQSQNTRPPNQNEQCSDACDYQNDHVCNGDYVNDQIVAGGPTYERTISAVSGSELIVSDFVANI